MTFTAGQILTADELNAALPVAPAVKSADETVTSSTTLQNDDHLFLSVAANAVYVLELTGTYNANASGDMKTTFTVPAGTTGLVAAWSTSDSSAVTDNLSLTATLVFDGTGADEQFKIWGRVITSATSGTLRFQWAQNASFGTGSIVGAGSFMKISRVS